MGAIIHMKASARVLTRSIRLWTSKFFLHEAKIMTRIVMRGSCKKASKEPLIGILRRSLR